MEHKHNKNQGLIFVLSGPSGSGKTTLLGNVIRGVGLRKKLVRSISFTTRPRRSREKNGEDYFFINETEFRQKLKAKKILEWTKYLGYYYATPRDFVEEQVRKNKQIILCLDLKGAARVKRLYRKNTVTIFIMPPSLETLRKRIEGRCSRTRKEEIKQRLRLARRELLASRKYDYCLVNNSLRRAVKELQRIILRETEYNIAR
jgi:guanylate kinase